MSKNVFISYRHSDAGWVRDTLYPVLSAGGARVLVDYKDFAAGIALPKQIREKQAEADVHLLVFTPDYFASDYCMDEMRRAVATDPQFARGTVLPLVLQACTLPPEVRRGDPLHVDLSGARNLDAEGWARVLRACGADLGTTAPDWLRAYRTTLRALRERRSVNLLAVPSVTVSVSEGRIFPRVRRLSPPSIRRSPAQTGTASHTLAGSSTTGSAQKPSRPAVIR